MSTIPGEIQPCGHCNGTGKCASGPHEDACAGCAAAAGLETDTTYQGLICAACKGVGSVWVGPKVTVVLRRRGDMLILSDAGTAGGDTPTETT